MKCRGKRDTTRNIPHSISSFPATFRVVSQKIDYLLDSVNTVDNNTPAVTKDDDNKPSIAKHLACKLIGP